MRNIRSVSDNIKAENIRIVTDPQIEAEDVCTTTSQDVEADNVHIVHSPYVEAKNVRIVSNYGGDSESGSLGIDGVILGTLILGVWILLVCPIIGGVLFLILGYSFNLGMKLGFIFGIIWVVVSFLKK